MVYGISWTTQKLKKIRRLVKMEKVEIRFHATALTNKSDHAIHGVTLYVVRGGHNRFIGNFESIDKAVLYALNNNFEIVGLVKDDFQC